MEKHKNLDFTISVPMMAMIAKVNAPSLAKIIKKIVPGVIETDQPKKKMRIRGDISLAREVISPFFKEKKQEISKSVHVFYNFKGGTGKSTLCYQTSCFLAFMGFKVLAIDFDPQAHLSSAFNFQEDRNIKTIYDVLVNQTPIEETICNVYEGFDVIPSNLGLTRVEVPLSQKTRREESFKKALESIKKEYDFILIDTNPTISNLNMNALFAADHVNIVCETQPFSLSGLGILVEELEKMYRDLGREFKFIVVPNKYESKTATAQEVLGILRKDYKDNIAQTVIRKCEDFNISSKLRLPVCCFVRKDSSALEDMIDFIYEFINMSSKPIK